MYVQYVSINPSSDCRKLKHSFCVERMLENAWIKYSCCRQDVRARSADGWCQETFHCCSSPRTWLVHQGLLYQLIYLYLLHRFHWFRPCDLAFEMYCSGKINFFGKKYLFAMCGEWSYIIFCRLTLRTPLVLWTKPNRSCPKMRTNVPFWLVWFS